MNSKLFIITALAVYSPCSPTFAQTEDVTPPNLTAFSFSPTTIDTSSGPASVTVNFSMTDDLSGVSQIYAYFGSPSNSLSVGGGTSIPGPQILSGSGTFTITFPQFSEQGVWTLHTTVLYDQIPNGRTLSATDMAAMDFPTQLTIGTLHYQFSGFLPPISDGGLNSAKAGQTIAAKWQLNRSGGEVVTELSAISGVVVLQIACANGEPVDSTVPADTSGESGLRFDDTADQFVFTWHSAKSWSGSCRRLQVNLNDGTTHSADFIFK